MPLGTGICEGALLSLICGGGGWSGYRGRQNSAKRRREYEECVSVLRSTPIFQRQLPKADIPLLAAELKRRSFSPGALLLKQGEISDDFLLVASGEASVLIGGEECAKLTKGDWWGDGSLLRRGPSNATIKVSGDEVLVAFTLCQKKFESMGLHRRLWLPNRHAIACGRDTCPCDTVEEALFCKGELTADDEEFIVKAMQKDTALQEFHDVRGDLVRAVARKASVRSVKAGSVVVSSGEFSQEFYIVKEGTVEVIPPLSRPRGIRSFNALAALEKLQAEEEESSGLSSFASDKGLGGKVGVAANSLGITAMLLSPRIFPRSHPSSESDEEVLPARSLNVRRSRPPSSGQSRRRCWRARTSLAKPMIRLKKGSVFGEDVMVYNAQHAATFRACDSGDVELYVVARQDYMSLLHHGSNGCDRYPEWCHLLDEVGALNVLFQSQRRELAHHARGYQRFERGAMVIKQGRRKESPLLYVVAAGGGKALVPQEGSDDLLEIPLRRGDVFGERSCLPVDSSIADDFSVRAGDQDHTSLTCLCIDVSLMKGFGVSEDDINFILCPCNLQESGMIQQSSRRTLLVRTASECFEVENLEPVCVLGSGGFGFVTLQRDRHTRRSYALKRISKGIIPPAFYENICAERDLMELADSKFIIRYICSWRDASFIYMILEAALGGDLNQLRPHLHDFDEGANAMVMFYLACIIAGLEHLHDRHVVFRDAKPENALLDSHGYAKLCDMGMARFVVGKTYTFCGTPDYMAPEILRCSGHDCAVDWWSLGVLAIDLLTGAPPWDAARDASSAWVKDLLLQQKQGLDLSDLPESPGSLTSFLKDLLVIEPAKRLGGGGSGAQQVRGHKWFTEAGFDFAALHRQDICLAPPFRPPEFKPPGLPMPDFKQDIPILAKEGRVVNGGRNVREERMHLQDALAMLQSDDSIDGFYTRMPQKPDEHVFVFFIQHRGEECVTLTERHGWVAYLKERSLFKPYTEDPSRPEWDASFALPPALCVAKDD